MVRESGTVSVDYEALFRSAPTGCVLTLVDGTVVEANDTLLRWAGLTRERLLGTNLLGLFTNGSR
ncbi:PAS domain-containing protein, partial [Arthrobacter sp. KK5.5]|uniref:PAS domain-containing protein n=1 Tax=Arthrobacter sp. KK5.5 TaxID=3373084 RepID=UPI003EE78123